MSNTQDEKEIERLKGILRDRLCRAPDRINAADVQTVRQYKAACVKAAKAIGKRSAKVSDLQSLINEVS